MGAWRSHWTRKRCALGVVGACSSDPTHRRARAAPQLVRFTFERVNPDNRSSMLQDVTAKRATEIGYLNEWLAKRGQQLGVPTPVNAHLARLIRAKEACYSDSR